MKHIEQIQPEYAADDMTALLLSDATASAALSRLLHDWTGCAIPPLDDTPQSEVEELVPLCLSILRRHWTTPLTALGDGTTPMSLADLMRRLIGDRVQGNETWSIPPANADIPTAVSALTKRHIDDGLTLTLPDGDGSADGSATTSPSALPTSLPDGLSLAQLLCGVSPDGTDLASSVTELQDSNKGWTMTKALSGFPNLKKLNLSAKSIFGKFRASEYILDELQAPYLEYIGIGNIKGNTFVYEYCRLAKTINCEELVLPSLSRIQTTTQNNLTSAVIENLPNCKRILLPSLTDIRTEGSAWQGRGTGTLLFCGNAPECEELITNISGDTNRDNTSATYSFIIAPKLRKFVVGHLTTNNDKGLWNTTSTELVHLEIGGATCSLDMREWNPTTALSERLPEFLSNFKTYIAHRLTDKGSGLTLTLSQAVRDAIQQDPEIVSIITSKGWTISPAPSV